MPLNRTKIINAVTHICSSRQKGQTVRFWAKAGAPVVSLDWDQEKKFVSAVREFLKIRQIIDNFTIREIEDFLKDTISATIQLPVAQRQTNIITSLNTFISSLRGRIAKYQIVIPVSNLSTTSAFTIGDVKFKNFTAYQERKWANISKGILKNNPNYTAPQKSDFVKELRKYHLKPLRGHVCAETICKATEKRAKDLALKKINEALDVLKFYLLTRGKEGYDNFGLEGEVLVPTIRSSLQLSVTGPRSFTPILQRVGPLFPITVGQKEIATMRKFGLNEMSKILKSTNRSWTDNRIMRAVYWYSRIFDTPIVRIDDEKTIIRRALPSAKKEQDLEYGCINQRLTKAFIAMECLYLIGERESIQNNISERAALLLAKGYPNRKNIKRFLKKMYKFRSNVVHRGITYVSIGELNQLIYLVKDSIITLLLKKNRLRLSSQNDFHQYFEKQKFK